MAWIRTIDQDHATDSLKTYYRKYADPFEGIDNIWKIHSLNPEALRGAGFKDAEPTCHYGKNCSACLIFSGR